MIEPLNTTHLEKTMSNLTINNLDEVRDLDRAACADIKGGMELPLIGEVPMYGLSNVLASINSASVSQNAVNFVMGGSTGGGDTVNYVGNATITPVNVSSPVTVVQGGLPQA
jgi:hypothetical protein